MKLTIVERETVRKVLTEEQRLLIHFATSSNMVGDYFRKKGIDTTSFRTVYGTDFVSAEITEVTKRDATYEETVAWYYIKILEADKEFGKKSMMPSIEDAKDILKNKEVIVYAD